MAETLTKDTCQPSMINEMSDLLVRSGQIEDDNARRALCIAIGIKPGDLTFLPGGTPTTFALQLVSHLCEAGNLTALRRLCDVIAPILKGPYAENLTTIRRNIEANPPTLAAPGAAFGQVLDHAKTIPEAKHLVELAENSLKPNCEQIKHMKEYKDAHDLLQQLEGHYMSLEIEIYESNKLIPPERLHWRQIRTIAGQMRTVIFELCDFVEKTAFCADCTEWVSNLRQASDALEQAPKSNDIQLIDEAAQTIFDVIDTQISQMNDRMVAHVDELNLPDLVDKLNKMYRVVQVYADPSIALYLENFQAAVDALTIMPEQLKMLRKDHNFLQQLDNKLRNEEKQLGDNVDRFKKRWEKNLRGQLLALSSPAKLKWEVELGDQIDELDRVLKKDSPQAIIEAFSNCRSVINNRFRQVDIDLKGLCKELIESGSSLEKALGKVAK